MTKHRLNHYIKNPEARFLIRLIAAVGYIIIGVLWWTLYGLTTVLYHIVCDAIETLFAMLETLATARYRLKQLHKKLSYFEMTLIAIGSIVIFTLLGLVMYFLMFSFTVIIPTGY